MSTQKKKIKDPHKARRSLDSVLAEVEITKKMGWGLEFVSAGYGAFDFEELIRYLEAIKKVWGKKIWLNIGYLSEEQMKRLKKIVDGVSVSIETVNWRLREKLCPSKPIGPMVETLKLCDKYGLKKSMTLVLGLGEKRADVDNLKDFIKENKLDRITFYRLKAQKGTIFEGKDELKTEDYVWWVKQTREEFPELKIIVGSWLDHFEEISLLLEAGAEAITKFPAIKMFGNKYAQQIEAEVKKSGKKLEGSLTKLPKLVLKGKKASEYFATMEKNINK